MTMPKKIACEGILFTLGAIDSNGDGYYLAKSGEFIRASNMYLNEGIFDEQGIPHYDEYAINGLYFAFDDYGVLDEYVLNMLCNPNCKVLNNSMRKFIAYHRWNAFRHDLNVGWDYAIEQLTNTNPSNDICILIGLYYQGYKAEDYKQTGDPDDGLCYDIRSFAVHKILEVLNNGN